MFKADTPAKIGLIDTPLQKVRSLVYKQFLNDYWKLKDESQSTPIADIEAQHAALKAAQKVIIYPLNK